MLERRNHINSALRALFIILVGSFIGLCATQFVEIPPAVALMKDSEMHERIITDHDVMIKRQDKLEVRVRGLEVDVFDLKQKEN